MRRASIVVITACMVMCACSKDGPGAELPQVTPPVLQSAPQALGGSGGATPKTLTIDLRPTDVTLDPGDLKSRFFGAGPTDIFRILSDLDSSIDEINKSSQSTDAKCLDITPVAYSLTPTGETVPFWAQCYESLGGSSFLQFGKKDGATYIYRTGPVGPVAARITPLDAAAGTYSVHAWIGIADGKVTGGSYGVIELDADPSAKSFEMTVAGIGFGYCGAQLRANSASVFFTGSIDMGTSCTDVGTRCFAASDPSVSAECDASLTRYSLAPLGRMASTMPQGSFGASSYPGGALDHVNLDGSATDATAFGPTAPTPGVAEFDGKP